MENFSLIIALNFQSGAKVTTCSEMFITLWIELMMKKATFKSTMTLISSYCPVLEGGAN